MKVTFFVNISFQDSPAILFQFIIDFRSLSFPIKREGEKNLRFVCKFLYCYFQTRAAYLFVEVMNTEYVLLLCPERLLEANWRLSEES